MVAFSSLSRSLVPPWMKPKGLAPNACRPLAGEPGAVKEIGDRFIFHPVTVLDNMV